MRKSIFATVLAVLALTACGGSDESLSNTDADAHFQAQCAEHGGIRDISKEQTTEGSFRRYADCNDGERVYLRE